MANITLNDKEQAGVTDELAELYRVSPCRETADACARLWLNVFPARVFPETGGRSRLRWRLLRRRLLRRARASNDAYYTPR